MGFAALHPSYELARVTVGWVERSETHHLVATAQPRSWAVTGM